MNAMAETETTENILRITEGGGNIHIRRLFSPTVLLQDWDSLHNENENNNSSANYWELFIDLLLVAAASSIADTFKESHSLSQFILSYMIIINGWFLYSYHLSTRFDNSSFATSLVLFIYLVGFGWSTANIRDFSRYTNPSDSMSDENTNNYNDAVKEFILGASILRTSIFIMIGGIALSLPRARYYCTVMSIIVSVSMFGFFIAFVGTIQANVTIILVGLWIAALSEFLSENISSRIVDIKKFIPVNIEQSQERFDALGLVMLGETVVSITQTFRELVLTQEDDPHSTSTSSTSYIVHNRYYIILILSLLLIFMMTLNIFHTAPSPEEHALRRSKAHAVTLMLVQKSIGLPLLCVGVSVKLIVEAVMKEEELSMFGYQCMSFGVGITLLFNFFIRLLHHGGKPYLRYGNHKHEFGRNTKMDRIAMLWWYTIAAMSCIPFLWYYLGITTQDPMTTTLYHAGLVFGLCFIESTFTHILLDMITQSSVAGVTNDHSTNTAKGEQQPLL